MEMDREQLFGIAFIAIGLILMILPGFSSYLILVIIDLLVMVLGANLIYREFKKGNKDLMSKRILAGIILILIALIFYFGFKHTSLFAGVQFILMGIIFMILGSLGLKKYIHLSKLVCTIILILGIVIFIVPFVTGFDLKASTFIVGMTTAVEGILLFLHK